ncbi:hypothetical protein BD770DRAFT_166495 [Pilaira anomala]|nr:hypothetical protein BD770DRAFT_166495 [Pilaira anomala]
MEEIKETLNSTWQLYIHYTFFTTFFILVVILPIVYTQTGTPPYWAICIIFGLLLLFYILYLLILYIYKSNLKHNEMNQPDQEEIIRLQNNSSSLHSQDPSTHYNPSTVGIPPSSFLAPTIQASIRSSSLDYTPPPPAYQDMIYPPSYRSTNSTKDDNGSVVY